MELDPEWYAYQCKSGEVLFYYNAVTGEHRWAVHFCSCFKSKLSHSTTEPCCLWEPVKSRTCESGKFVRSIGTETDDQYFTDIPTNDETTESPRAEITFEYSVSKDRLNEDDTTEIISASSTEKPVEVFLEDPFISSGDKQNSSKRITLKLKEISSQEFSLADNIPSQKEPRRVDSISFPRKSPAITNDSSKATETSSSEKHTFVKKRKLQHLGLDKPLVLSSSPGLAASSVHDANNGENSFESLHAKRQRGSASSRKNPEPRKLLKRSNSNNEESKKEWKDSDEQECYEGELRETGGFDGAEEHSLVEDPIALAGEPSSSSLTPALTKQEDSKVDADDQRSICQLCGKECATPAMLTNHLMKHQPTGTSCPICKKYFSRRQGLRHHVQTHAGDKPHACKICSKTFTKSASLVAHYRTHSGIRPFKCPKCNKGFTHSSNLSSHLRIHSSLRPYRCHFCSKGFKTSSHLTLHIRSHSDERPYVCAECGKAFKNSSHLRSHEKLHLLPKTVFCNKCGEGFRSFSHLIYHQQLNSQCAEDDDQEHYQVRGKNASTHSNFENESKMKQSHMGEQRMCQYSNDDVRREEYGTGSNMEENSSQREKTHQSTSMSASLSNKSRNQKIQQSALVDLSPVVKPLSPGKREHEIPQSFSDTLSNRNEYHKNVLQSSSSTHAIEDEKQFVQQDDTKGLVDELEKQNIL